MTRPRADRRKSTPSARAPRPRRAFAVLATLAAAAAGAGLWLALQPEPRRERPRTPWNVLLVTLDTIRADRLGCYGHTGAKTRHLDRLAAEGVRFAQAVSPAPITLPAHASIFTAMDPPTHGVRNNGNFYLGERFGTLATALKAHGYRTAAFVSSFILDRRYGLARGFDLYDDAMQGSQGQVVAFGAERRGDRTALILSRWLEEQGKEASPFFAWLHLYDPHEPYRPPPPFRDLFAHDPYDGEVAFDDAVVASVLDRLGRLGLLDRTLVAVIGDHGESLGDHGEETHSMFVYESAIRVPFLLWRPGAVPAGLVVEAPVRAIDLAPTLLDLVGAPPLPRAEGRSLVPVLEGRAAGPPPAAYAETLLPQLYMNWAPLRAIRDGRFKLIDAPRPELYDLAQDPGERTNLHAERPEIARGLRSLLEEVTGGREGTMSVVALDREAMEKLAALGYVGAGAEPPAAPGESRRDPKEVIQVFNRLRKANTAVRDRRFDEALPILREVLAEDPRNAFARLVTGSAHMGKGDYAKAIDWFKKYLEIVPTSAYAHQWIALCHVRSGHPATALAEAEAALALDPRFTDARVLKAGLLASRGAHAEAVAELRHAVETDPAKAILRLDLARVLAEAGRREEARREYDEALRLRPRYAPALTGLGVLAAEKGDLEGAVARFREALDVDQGQDEARFDLGEALARMGRRDEASQEYRRLLDSPTATPTMRARARERLASLRD